MGLNSSEVVNSQTKGWTLDVSDISGLCSDLREYVGKGIVILFGSCTADFDGRIKSTLSIGDRLLVIKQDTSVALHGLTAIKPLNWQLAHAGVLEFREVTMPGGKMPYLEFYSYRPKTKESFSIVFEFIYQASVLFGIDNNKLVIEGDEADLAQYLTKNPQVIEAGIQITGREIDTPLGKIDLMGTDKEGRTIIIELKKSSISPADAFQIIRYRESFVGLRNDPGQIRAIIVGSTISERLKEFLAENSVDFVSVKWQELFPAVPRTRARNLKDFASLE